jgi:diketogulonate reductase-like aldo/keto reductase
LQNLWNLSSSENLAKSNILAKMSFRQISNIFITADHGTNRLSLSSGVKLAQGNIMPMFGLGTYLLHDQRCRDMVKAALDLGVRHIDTAAFYRNERDIGLAIRESKVSRKEIFVTSKLWIDSHGYQNALRAFNETMNQLQLDYVDLYLIHWPGSSTLSSKSPENSKYRSETWKALEKVFKDGKAKAIGVSNYTIAHLEELLRTCEVRPSVNQVEFHPLLYQKQLLEFCHTNGIVLEGYSPFGKGTLLKNAEIQKVAKKYNKSSAQILLRWSLQHHVPVIPKCSTVERLKENLQIYDFDISEEDMNFLNSLHQNWHCTWNPEEVL